MGMLEPDGWASQPPATMSPVLLCRDPKDLIRMLNLVSKQSWIHESSPLLAKGYLGGGMPAVETLLPNGSEQLYRQLAQFPCTLGFRGPRRGVAMVPA